MTLFRVELRRFVCLNRLASVTMVRHVELPFVPTPAIRLGLAPHSDFDADADRVKEVLWHAPSGRFVAALEEYRIHQQNPREVYTGALRRMVEDGWRLRLLPPSPTADEADEFDPGAYHVVRLGGLYYSASGDDVECLIIQGEEFVIVREGRLG